MVSEIFLGRGITLAVAVLCLYVCQTGAYSEESALALAEKRAFSSECQCCMQTYDRSCCEKCFESKASSVTPYFSKRSAPQFIQNRVRRFTGCNCCYMSRFSNGFCCDVCQTASKRWGKRSGEVEPLPEIEDKVEVDFSQRRNPDCYCCGVFKNKDCCERCLDDIFI